jgi:hypothetical protein
VRDWRVAVVRGFVVMKKSAYRALLLLSLSPSMEFRPVRGEYRALGKMDPTKDVQCHAAALSSTFARSVVVDASSTFSGFIKFRVVCSFLVLKCVYLSSL